MIRRGRGVDDSYKGSIISFWIIYFHCLELLLLKMSPKIKRNPMENIKTNCMIIIRFPLKVVTL